MAIVLVVVVTVMIATFVVVGLLGSEVLIEDFVAGSVTVEVVGLLDSEVVADDCVVGFEVVLTGCVVEVVFDVAVVVVSVTVPVIVCVV